MQHFVSGANESFYALHDIRIAEANILNNVIIMQSCLGVIKRVKRYTGRNPFPRKTPFSVPPWIYTEACPDPPAGALPSAGFCPPSHVMGLRDPINEEGACAALDEAAAGGKPSAGAGAPPFAVGASPAGGVAVACPTMAWRGTMLGYCHGAREQA